MRSGFETCEPKKLASLISDSEVLPASGLSEEAGTVIGRYKLLQLIGEGGFGSVFMAEQQSPVVRKVALKIIKLGMDTKQVIARFEAERQALAMMDHPNIAKVFDAGATDTGRPYFVMELVKGVPITDYCDQQKLSLRQRLELFIPICKAVQHAHQKGIIHRDLKPSNVLVTLHDGTPVPKVIDFGIAKATNARLTEHTLFTEYRQFIGTPEYISPEQADISALDVDTRSDVYSLGVLLYQLLTGTTPFESRQLRNVAYAEIQRIIREVDPPKPSTRLSTIATATDSRTVQATGEPKRLSRLVAGELDWIVMKCLEKDRTRRYDTAVALADDVQRHLNGDAVEASPPSKSYRLRKFVRKHQVVMAVVSLLLVATVVSTWQAIRATQARNAEAAEHRQSEAVATLLESLFAAPNPFSDNQPALDVKTKLTAQLDHMTLTLEHEYNGDPLVLARLRNAIGMTEFGLGENAKALAIFRAAASDLQESAGPDDLKTLNALNNVAKALNASGQSNEAITLFQYVRQKRASKLGSDDADTMLTLRDLAAANHDAGNYAEMVKLLEQVRQQQMESLGPDDLTTLTTLGMLADGYRHIGRSADAIKLLKHVRDEQTRTLGLDHPNTCVTMVDLALACQEDGQISEAIGILEQVRDREIKAFGPDHPENLTLLNNLAVAYQHAGRFNEAVKLFEQVRRQQIKTLGPTHEHTLATGSNLAMAYVEVGRTAEAVQLLEQARDQEATRLGLENPHTLITLNNLSTAYSASGRLTEAIELSEKVLQLRTQVLGPQDPATLRTANNLANMLSRAGRINEAIKLLQEVLDQRVKILAPDHPETLTTMDNLAVSYARTGRTAEAIRLLEQTSEKQAKKLGPDHPDTLQTLASLANVYAANGQLPEAVRLLEQVKEKQIRKLGSNHPDTLATVKQLSVLYERQAAGDAGAHSDPAH